MGMHLAAGTGSCPLLFYVGPLTVPHRAGVRAASAVPVVVSSADDSKKIAAIRELGGQSGELTEANFSNENFFPFCTAPASSLYSFLLRNSDLVDRINCLRRLMFAGESYILVSLNDPSSLIQVYKDNNGVFSDVGLASVKYFGSHGGSVYQLHAVFGNDKIRSLYDDAVARERARETATSSAGAGAGGAGAAAGAGGGAGVAEEDGSRPLFTYLGKRVHLSPSTFAQGTALGVPELVASHTQYQQVIKFLQSKAALQDSLEAVAVVIHDGTPKVLYSNGTQWFIDGAEPALHTATDTLQVVCGLFGKDAVQKFITDHVDVLV
jgi:hypothetical protein